MRPTFSVLLRVSIVGLSFLFVRTQLTAWGAEQVKSNGLAQEFVALFSDPPALKSAVFERSKNYYFETGDDGKKKRDSGFTSYEGALYPSGFFLRHLKNSIFDLGRTPSPGSECVFGASDRWLWELEAGHDVLLAAPLRMEDGASLKNARDRLTRSQRGILYSIQRFGVDPLTNMPIRWTGSDTFVAQGSAQTRMTGRFGKIDEFGRPGSLFLYLKSTADSNAAVSYHVQFFFGAPKSLFPLRSEFTGPDSHGENITYTNFIHSLTWDALTNGPSQGYTASQFRNKTQPLTQFIVSSNRSRFFILPSGSWQKIDENSPQVLASAMGGAGRKTALVSFLLCLFVFLGTVFFVRKSAREQRDQTIAPSKLKESNETVEACPISVGR